MKLKLKTEQWDFINKSLLVGQKDLKDKINFNDGFLESDDDIIDTIREWALVKVQEIGFDSNYTLTVEGRILEEIIDLFYIK
ncbi:MAG: hypothetical protein ABIN13_15635 [Mucilaginibacter sp.]